MSLESLCIPLFLMGLDCVSSDGSQESDLRLLSADGRELEEAFERDAGKVRLLLVLSPT